MLTQQELEYQLTDRILPLYQFHPYPDVTERDAWNQLPEVKKQQAIRDAEQFLAYRWPALLATDFMSFYRNGERKTYEDPHLLRRRALSTLVMGECMEGNGRFLDDIINGIWLICEESYWGVSAHNGKSAFLDSPFARQPLPDIEEPYLDLFAGETGNLLAWTACLLHPALDHTAPQVCRRISLELERRIKQPFLHHNDTNWMGFIATNKVNNWNPWITANVLNVFLLTEHDINRRAAAVKKMFEVMDHFLNTYGADGGCDEGTSYWSRAGGSVHDFCDQLFRASGGRIDLFQLPLIKQIGRFIYREHIAGPYFINFADGDAKAGCDRTLIYHYGIRIHDQKLMDLAAALPEYVPDELDGPPVSLQRWLCGLFDCCDYVRHRSTAQPPLVRDVWLPDIQVAAAREQAGSSDGLYLAVKGGHNDESHNHNDVGNFIVYLNGLPALIDVGVGVYTQKTFSADRYEIWNMQSSYHNLPAINGAQQCAGARYRAQDIHCQPDGQAVEISMELSQAYHPDAALQTFRRHYHFERSVPSIILENRFLFLHNENSVSEYLMCRQKPVQKDAGSLVVPVSADAALLIHYDPGYLVSIEEIELPDKRLQKSWGNLLYRIRFYAYGLPSQVNFRLVLTPK